MIGRLLALALAWALAACGAPAGDWPPPSPALWEVTGAEGQRGWLFGTIHSLPNGAEWRTPALESVIGQADLLVVELANLGEGGAGARAFAEASTSAGLPPLLQRVPAEDRPALSRALARAGLDEADLVRTETWGAALILANRAKSGDNASGADRALLAAGLPVVGLEDFAGQFALFDRLAEADQAELLRLAVADAERGDREAQVAWLTGDLVALERAALAGVLADPELRQVLISGRNITWAGRIAEWLDEGRRPLVAVGAGHMMGEDGLPALLAARGYRVVRIQ